MKKQSMRTLPAVAAMAAALLMGANVHAQTNNTTTPPGTTKPQDAVTPAPGNTAMPARAGADAQNSSGNPVASSATQTPGTNKSKDAVSPAPTGGTARSAEDRAAAKQAKADKRAAKRDARKAPVASKGSPPVDGVDTTKGGTK